jgi:hypothetical protein
MVYRVSVDPKPNCETVMIEKDRKIYIGRYNIQDGVLYLWARGPWGFHGRPMMAGLRRSVVPPEEAAISLLEAYARFDR